MSQKISQLPAVIAANISDTDILPIVATNITSKVTVANLRTKLGTQPPLGGRTVTDSFTYLTNNAVFNVKDYGAFGDNVTNDSTAIQNAINAASAAGGGIVYFPQGNYRFLTGINVLALVTIRGAGIGATQLIYTGAAIGFTLTGDGATSWNAGIFDLTLKTTGTIPAYPGTYGIKLINVVDYAIERVQITRWGTAGVLLNGTIFCGNITFDECDIHENQGGIYMSGNNAVVNHIVIRSSKVRASEDYNIYVPQDVRNWLILGNDLEAGKVTSIWMNFGLGISIISNYFEQSTAVPCIQIADSLTVQGLTIFGNNIAGTGVANGASAIKLGTTGAIYGAVVAGNIITAYQVGIESNGVQTGQLGPNSFSTVGTRYKYTVTQATARGLTTFDETSVRGLDGVGPDVGNAAVTIVNGTDSKVVQFNTPITANRAVTVTTTNAQHGDSIHVIRRAAATGAFTVDVGPGPLKSLAVSQWCKIIFDGNAGVWLLHSFGSL